MRLSREQNEALKQHKHTLHTHTGPAARDRTPLLPLSSRRVVGRDHLFYSEAGPVEEGKILLPPRNSVTIGADRWLKGEFIVRPDKGR